MMDFDFHRVFYSFLPILWALTVHEFAHGWMAYRCGDDTAERMGRLTLNPLAHLDLFGTLAFLFFGFGWAKPVPVNPNRFGHYRRDEILVSLAGVGANLISAIGFGLVFRLVARFSGSEAAWVNTTLILLYVSVRINLILILFNLIPLPPLDGSHVLREMLPEPLREQYQRFIQPMGMFLLLLLVTVGSPVLGWIIGRPVSWMTYGLTGVSF